jgi:hypothetical protein
MPKHVLNLNKTKKTSCVVTCLFPVSFYIYEHKWDGTAKENPARIVGFDFLVMVIG